MNRIRLLPEQVANQIAAGEVIERPASVVKELVENALDAQATRVTVEIGAGGRSLVRVTDDGLGMSRDDALLCLERHATSKIQRAEDLAAIATMGFRGEAIPSIASVSRMTITTRERASQAAAATQIVIHGGKIMEVRDAGSPPGTCVEVRSLFYNLPARRKFLRTEETESSHIQHYLTLAALSCPEVAFTFVRDSKTLWQLPAVKSEPTANARLTSLRERMRALFGGETQFLTVDFTAKLADVPETPEPDAGSFETAAAPSPTASAAAVTPDAGARFRLWGYIGAPGVARGTREDQHLFVNRRPVENRALNFALVEGYHTMLMKGRYPVCCLFLEINPANVDVNIHPAKREVKFHNERDVRRLVAQAVRETLVKFHEAGGPAPTVQAPANRTEPLRLQSVPKMSPAPEPEAERTLPITPAKPAPEPKGGLFRSPYDNASSRGQLPLPAATQPAAHSPGTAVSAKPLPTAASVPGGESLKVTAALPSPAQPLLNVPLRIVGVIGRLYVVMESDRGLVLLDQHAAHERILFEQVLDRMQHGNAPSQRLLLPETMELSARDAQFVRELLPTFARLGVGLSEFGERTFLLDGLPPFVKVTEPRRFVLDVIDELKATGETVNALRLGEHTVAKMVCRHAVKAHDPLAGPELEKLVDDLRGCAMPYTCPHGRPTLIEMNFRELEKKFGRLA